MRGMNATGELQYVGALAVMPWDGSVEVCPCRGVNYLVAKPWTPSFAMAARHGYIPRIESIVLRRYWFAWGASKGAVYAEDEAQANRVFADCIFACWLAERIQRWEPDGIIENGPTEENVARVIELIGGAP